jgi:hypothetical protein
VESEATQVQREQAAAKLAAEKAMAAEIERVAALEAARIEREERLAADAAAENERLKAEALLEAQRAEAEKERTAKEAEAVRLTALENRRSMNRAINEATRALESGDLARAAKDLELARSFKIFDKRIPALQTNLDRAYQDRAKPVTDAEFERAVKSFHALKRAIETKDVASMDELTVTSNQNALFAQLISRFASLDIEITGIRVRNTDRSVVGILRIDRMLRANGDLTMPSDTYRNREIKRRRINGRWTLIEW